MLIIQYHTTYTSIVGWLQLNFAMFSDFAATSNRHTLMHVMSTVPISIILPQKFNDMVNQVEAAKSTMGRYITEIWSQKQRFGGEQPHTESKLLRADTNCGFTLFLAVLSAIYHGYVKIN